MIYLWVSCEGWKKFELTDKKAIKERDIYISASAEIGHSAKIGDYATPIIIYIIGSRYPLSYWGEDRIDIGCMKNTIGKWLELWANGRIETIAEAENYSKKQLNEYKRYIKMIAQAHKIGE